MLKLKCNRSGFTLLEILIVVVILAALAGLAIPAYTTTTERVKKQEAIQALTALRESQQRYYMANASYTNSNTALDFDVTSTQTGSGTPLFSYNVTAATAGFSGQAYKLAAGSAGGLYTMILRTDGSIVSNF